jgi:hypothetical protein
MCERISALSHPYSITNEKVKRYAQLEPGMCKPKCSPQPTHRINWCQPIIWSLIEKTAQSVGYPWSPVEIVRQLQQIDPELFAVLRPQRISQWWDHNCLDVLKWTDSHQHAIEAGSWPIVGERCKGILVSSEFLLGPLHISTIFIIPG